MVSDDINLHPYSAELQSARESADTADAPADARAKIDALARMLSDDAPATGAAAAAVPER